MNKIKKIATLLAMILIAGTLQAQPDSQQVEMATGLYQSGKIYVVVGVIAIIFAGIITYLVMLDRKVTKLEKNINRD